jgi:RimJ/RimL family protein N-acetyltransferase
MDLQPTLKGKLLELHPLLPEDFEGLFSVSSDPLVWEQHPQFDRYKRDVFENFFKVALESNGALKVIDKKTREIIGSSRFYDFDPIEKTVVIGYTFLNRKCWGKRYNEEMKDLMLNHAFQYANRVLFQVGDQNTRSQLAMKKIGAQFLKKEILDNKGHIIYKIDKFDWFPK